MKKLFKTIYYGWYSLIYILYDLIQFGNFLRTKTDAATRLKICRECDRIKKVMNKFEICDECQCYMPLKVKLHGTSCPLGESKWT